MKKKGITDYTIGILLTVTVIAVLLLVVAVPYKEAVAYTGNVDGVRQWVLGQQSKAAVTTGVLLKESYPPISSLEDPLKINTVNDINSDEVKQEIVDSIYDCGNAFFFGDPEHAFLGTWDSSDSGYVFCYKCRRIEFSDEVKQSNVNINGVSQYMSTHSPFAGGTPKYSELLNSMNENLFQTTTPPSEDIITTTNDKYIMYIATHKIDTVRAGCLIQRDIGSAVGTSTAKAALTGINFLGSGANLFNSFVEKDKFSSSIIITEPKNIASLCGYDKQSACTTTSAPSVTAEGAATKLSPEDKAALQATADFD